MRHGILVPYTNAEKKALRCMTAASTTLPASLDEPKFLAIPVSTLSRNAVYQNRSAFADLASAKSMRKTVLKLCLCPYQWS